MTVLVEERSRITAKGQTTVPKSVRQALGLGSGDEIAFVVSEDGVALRRVEADTHDPALASFLRFLADDISRRPEAVASIPKPLLDRMTELTAGIEVDLDAPIDGDVDL